MKHAENCERHEQSWALLFTIVQAWLTSSMLIDQHALYFFILKTLDRKTLGISHNFLGCRSTRHFHILFGPTLQVAVLLIGGLGTFRVKHWSMAKWIDPVSGVFYRAKKLGLGPLISIRKSSTKGPTSVVNLEALEVPEAIVKLHLEGT